MQEMRTDSVGDLIEYLIIQMKTGPEEDRNRMAEMLRSVIEGLEGAEIEERDAVVLQALSWAMLQAASDDLDKPEQVKRLLFLASRAIAAATRPLEAVTGLDFSEKTAEFLAPIGNFH
jgi:hypothetical protein